MTNLERAKDLYQRMSQGPEGMMSAFEEYYDDNCRIVEMANNEVREGKAAQRAAIQEWGKNVKQHHGGGMGAITSNEDAGTVCVESWGDMEFQDGKRWKMSEVAVQQWKDGKIVEEKFYYHNPMAMAPQPG